MTSAGLAAVAKRRLLGGDTAAATGQAPIASPGTNYSLAAAFNAVVSFHLCRSGWC
jgi:hypothetical protein